MTFWKWHLGFPICSIQKHIFLGYLFPWCEGLEIGNGSGSKASPFFPLSILDSQIMQRKMEIQAIKDCKSRPTTQKSIEELTTKQYLPSNIKQNRKSPQDTPSSVQTLVLINDPTSPKPSLPTKLILCIITTVIAGALQRFLSHNPTPLEIPSPNEEEVDMTDLTSQSAYLSLSLHLLCWSNSSPRRCERENFKRTESIKVDI